MVAREADHRNDRGRGTPPRRIVDAHHHVWDTGLGKHPWLCEDPPIRFRYGDYSGSAGRISPPITAATRRLSRSRPASMSRRNGATTIRPAKWTGLPASWRARACRASRWRRLGLTGRIAPWCSRAMQRGDLCAPCATSRAPILRREVRPGRWGEAAWRAGFARLAPLGLRFDLQTPWWHLGEARGLADAFPSTRIVLNHTGLPSDRSPGNRGLAERHGGARRRLQRRGQDLGHRPARQGLDRGGEPRGGPDHDRSLRCRALHVREQLSGGLPVRQLRPDLRRLRRDRRGFPRGRAEALFAGNAMRIYDIGGPHG